MTRTVFTMKTKAALLAAACLAFRALNACAGGFVEPGAGLDVQYATQPDGTLSLVPPKSKLDMICYSSLLGATSTNNILAWRILNASMSSRHMTPELLAENDPGCNGL